MLGQGFDVLLDVNRDQPGLLFARSGQNEGSAMPSPGADFEVDGHVVGLDSPTPSAITRDTLGYRPEQPGLLTYLREGGYFC